MGQKVNPHELRIEIIKNWESEWYDEAEANDIPQEVRGRLPICSIIYWDARVHLEEIRFAIRQFMKHTVQKMILFKL